MPPPPPHTPRPATPATPATCFPRHAQRGQSYANFQCSCYADVACALAHVLLMPAPPSRLDLAPKSPTSASVACSPADPCRLLVQPAFSSRRIFHQTIPQSAGRTNCHSSTKKTASLCCHNLKSPRLTSSRAPCSSLSLSVGPCLHPPPPLSSFTKLPQHVVAPCLCVPMLDSPIPGHHSVFDQSHAFSPSRAGRQGIHVHAHLIVLSVLRRIHWGICLFWRAFLARIFLILKVLWAGCTEQKVQLKSCRQHPQAMHRLGPARNHLCPLWALFARPAGGCLQQGVCHRVPATGSAPLEHPHPACAAERETPGTRPRPRELRLKLSPIDPPDSRPSLLPHCRRPSGRARALATAKRAAGAVVACAAPAQTARASEERHAMLNMLRADAQACEEAPWLHIRAASSLATHH